jgi:DNA-binding transcriptional MerR regulator
MDDKKYRIGELAEKAGVTKRTVHYYISRGLIPPSEGTGQQSYYSDDHLVRILLVKKLQERYLPLEKIKKIIAGLSYDNARIMLEKKAEIELEDLMDESRTGQQTDFPLGTECRKIELAQGLELYCSGKVLQGHGDKIKLLIEYSKRLFNEN